MTSSTTVKTGDLYAALAAVTPHAGTEPDLPATYRVRLVADGTNLVVTASNRYTAGMAIASIEDSDAEPGTTVDLLPNEATDVMRLFKAKLDDEELQTTIRLAGSGAERHVGFVDSSGMLDGKEFVLPAHSIADGMPDIPTLAAGTLRRKRTATTRLVATGKFVKLFSAAATAYGESLTLEPTSETTPMVLACGESFLGLLMPSRPSDEELAKLDGWRKDWLARLPEPAVAAAS